MAEDRGEIPGDDMGLVDILEEFIQGDHESWDKSMKLWASDFGTVLGPDDGGHCKLQFWLSCRNAPRKKNTPGELLMFKAGKLMEQWAGDTLKKWLPMHGWEVIGEEVRARTENLSGRMDFLLRHVATGKKRVLEVKTKRGAAFGHLKTAAVNNVMQCQFYIKAEDADDGVVLYLDREGQNFARAFKVERDDKTIQWAEEELVRIRDGEKPAPMAAKLTRTENKGPDSVYLELPWQVAWCKLKTCECKAAIGPMPKGIVAKIDKKKRVVTATEGNEKYLPTVIALLRAAYPKEIFNGPSGT